MVEKEYSDKEIEALDEYVKVAFNHKIYEELCGEDDDPFTDYEGLFEPLEFFRLFYLQIDFIRQNKEKPLFVSRNLKKLQLNDKQLYYFYDKLVDFFKDEKKKDEQIKICCREIVTLQNNLKTEEQEDDDEDNNYVYVDNKPKFEDALKHLETLPTLREKIAYLIKEEYEYEQKYHTSHWDNSTFTRNCKLEREKLQKLAQLQPVSKPKISQPEFIEVGKNKDLTLDRTIFLLNRLIPSFLDCEATKKAEFINFLTGFDFETTRQRFSSIHKKELDSPQAFTKDMEIVCKYLNILGLKDIVTIVKNDLKFR